MPALLVLKGPLQGEELEIQSGVNILGRNPVACDIVLNHDAVSRRHAMIEIDESGTWIEDLVSHNGTLLNDERLDPGPAGRRPLEDGDLVTINGFQMIYYVDATSKSKSQIMLTPDDAAHEIISSVDIGSSVDQTTLEYPTAKLRALLRVIDDLGDAIELRDVPRRALQSLLGSFEHAISGFILMRTTQDSDFRPAAVLSREEPNRRVRMSKTIVDMAVESKTAVLSTNASEDQRFADAASVAEMKLHSLMCAPLLDRTLSAFGVLQIESRAGSPPFTAADLHVFAGVTRHVAAVIERARHHDAALSAQRSHYERQFRNLVEGSIQGILIHRNFRPLFVNQAWARYHGMTARQVLTSETVATLINPADLPDIQSVVRSLQERRADSAINEYRAIRADGATVWFDNVMTSVEWNGKGAVQSVITDITMRKEAERVLRRAKDDLEQRVAERTIALSEANARLKAEIEERKQAQRRVQESESLYQSLVDTIPMGVARKGLDGRYTFANRSFAGVAGSAVEQVVGCSDDDLFTAERAEEHRRASRQAIESERMSEIVERVVDVNVSTDRRDSPADHRVVHTICSPIRDSGGEIAGVQLIVADVTALKAAEQELIQYADELRRSNHELSQFASVVSHDLSAPLRAIASYAQLLDRQYRGQLDEKANEFLAYIVGGALRMRTLIDDLQEYARVTTRARPVTSIDSRHVLKYAIANLHSEIEESAGKVEYDAMPTVLVDETQLIQLFQNLIGNAIKYRSDRPLRIAIRSKAVGQEWQFCVVDNGIGIPPSDRERVFIIHQRLHTADEYPGTGLGLALCKRIVERHGGRIWVEDGDDGGTALCFTLPMKSHAMGNLGRSGPLPKQSPTGSPGPVGGAPVGTRQTPHFESITVSAEDSHDSSIISPDDSGRFDLSSKKKL